MHPRALGGRDNGRSWVEELCNQRHQHCKPNARLRRQGKSAAVRLIFRLAWEGDGTSGPMGVKSIATHLNASGIRTRDGGKWGIDAVHKVLTRTTYAGRHRFNTKFWKTRQRKAETEIVEMSVPAIVDKDEFEVVQMLLKSRSPAMVAPRVVSGPTLLTGICFCAACGGAMTLRTGKSGR